MATYSYRISPYGVTASITSPDNNTPAPIAYKGTGSGPELVEIMLSKAYGAFGHRFNPKSDTPTDLDYALFSTFGEANVERLGPTPSYDPGIPRSAVT